MAPLQFTQRHWVTQKLCSSKDSYREFLEDLVDNARKEQKDALSKFLQLNEIDPLNDIAVLSIFSTMDALRRY
jgi:hypothetical protein